MEAREAVTKILAKYPEEAKKIIKLYREGDVYNFYLKADGLEVEQVNTVEASAPSEVPNLAASR